MRKYLFADHELSGTLEFQKKRMLDAIDQAPQEDIRNRSMEGLVERFVSDHRVAAPEITEGAISVNIEEAKVDVSQDIHRAIFDRSTPFFVQGVAATYFVPFSGDKGVLVCRPSTSSTVYPIAEISESEIIFRYENADSNVAVTKKDFDRDLGLVGQYLGWAKQDIEKTNAQLPAMAKQRLSARIARLQQVDAGLKDLGLPVRSGSPLHTAAPIPPTPGATPKIIERYDVAFSFAGEDRVYVEKVADNLRESGVTVFYDKFERASLWGKNLIDHLAEIYQKRSRYVVMFISSHYIGKPWPTHERTHAQARALLTREEYILPARFDDTEVPGLAGTVGHIDLRETSPGQLADLIRMKVEMARHLTG